MNLYFERSNGEMLLVSSEATEENVLRMISADVKKRNSKFKIHYFRCTKLTKGFCYDIGSHSEFYWLTNDKFERYPKESNND